MTAGSNKRRAHRDESFEKVLEQRVDEMQEALVRTQREAARAERELRCQIDVAAKRNDDLRAELLASLREVSDLKARFVTVDASCCGHRSDVDGDEGGFRDVYR